MQAPYLHTSYSDRFLEADGTEIITGEIAIKSHTFFFCLFVFARQYHQVWRAKFQPRRDAFRPNVCIMRFTAVDGWFVLNIGGVKSKERLQQGGRSRLVRLGKQSTRRGASGCTVCYHEWKSAKRRLFFSFFYWAGSFKTKHNIVTTDRWSG